MLQPLVLGSWGCYGRFVVEEFSTHTSHAITTMNLTKSFPPADDLFVQLQQVDYQKLYKTSKTFVLTAAAIVFVVANILWEKIQVMKFRTPDFLSDYVYFSVNLIGEPGDEIVGLSVGNRYVGLYDNGIAWGVLNAQGALTNQ
jgi:hypothetical protein